MLKKIFYKIKKKFLTVMLVVSLFSTSVFSSYEIYLEEVQAAGGLTAWNLFIGILSALGFFAGSGESAKAAYDDFCDWADDFGNSASVTVKTALLSSGLKDCIISSGYTELSAESVTLAAEALLMGVSLDRLSEDSGTYFYPYSVEMTEDGTFELTITVAEEKYCVVITGKSLYRGSWVLDLMSKDIEFNYSIYDISGAMEQLKSGSASLLVFLKQLISAWIAERYTDAGSNVKVKIGSGASSLASTVSPENSFRMTVYDFVKDCSPTSMYTSDFLHSLLSYSDAEFIQNVQDQGFTVPESYVLAYWYRTGNPYNNQICLSDDLSGCSLIYDSSNKGLYIINAEQVSSKVSKHNIFENSSGPYVYDVPIFKHTVSDFTFIYDNYWIDKKNPFSGYNNGYFFGRYLLVNFDLSNYYTSLENYDAGISYLDELNNVALFGSADLAQADDSDVYVPDAAAYEKMIVPLAEVAGNQKALADQLAAIQAQYAQAVRDMQEAIENGTDVEAGLLQKIIDAVMALPDSILNGLHSDITAIAAATAGTKNLLGDIDGLINEKLPVIGNIADTGEESLAVISGIGANVQAMLKPIGLLNDISITMEGIAKTGANADTLLQSIASSVANVEKSVAVSPSVEPEAPDSFSNNFFLLLYGLFMIIFKLILIFYHSYKIILTIHATAAYPYFLNSGMITGLNWLREFKITGELLNISLYDFLFFLVRIILIFSVVGLIRKRVDSFNI